MGWRGLSPGALGSGPSEDSSWHRMCHSHTPDICPHFYLCLMPLLDSSPENPFSSWDWAQVLYPVPYWAEWDSSWNSYISRGSWTLPAPDIPSIWPQSILCHSHLKNKTPPGTAQPTCFPSVFKVLKDFSSFTPSPTASDCFFPP